MNGIIIVDKPAGWTSQDVCSKLRGSLHERRVGHSGTLDPMATGVLPVFVGRATRAVEFAENDRKRYTAAMRAGVVTDTQDTTGNVLASSDIRPAVEELLAVLPEFTGPIKQIPPMYSAVKIGGRKLYELARRGESVERKARDVTVWAVEYLGTENGDILLDVECSKGTYIRTLINDIGERLGCGAAMSALRRTRAGAFTLDDAHTLDEIIKRAEKNELDGILLPVDSLFKVYDQVTVSDDQERKCRCGAIFPTSIPDGEYRVYSRDGEFLMLGAASDGQMRTIKSFFTV